MASRKSRSNAPSASRADPRTGFLAALDAIERAEPGTMQHALQQALASKDSLHCAQALRRAAEAACRRSDSGDRIDRIRFPWQSLPPLP
jgi:hypothetical protein